MSGWSKPAQKWDWRAFLTEEEAAQVSAADAAKAEWQRFQAIRASIQNRAIQRARYAAGSPPSSGPIPHGKRDGGGL